MSIRSAVDQVSNTAQRVQQQAGPQKGSPLVRMARAVDEASTAQAARQRIAAARSPLRAPFVRPA